MEEELKLPEPVALFRCYESRDIAEVKVKSDLLGNGDALYTAEQVRQAVLAERERAIQACEAEKTEHMEMAAQNNSRSSDFAFGRVAAADNIAAAIRKG